MLNEYHKKYMEKSDSEIAVHVQVKEIGLRQVFGTLGLPRMNGPEAAVLVLGCADKRFVPEHERIFSSILGRPVKLLTIDVETEHLSGVPGVIQHNATEPLPGGPYDVVYGDVLVRFVEPEKQSKVLKNSYDSLAAGGMAIHIFAKEDFDPPAGYAPLPGTHKVDMNSLQLELTKIGIQYLEVPLRYDVPKPGMEGEKMLIDELAIVLRKG